VTNRKSIIAALAAAAILSGGSAISLSPQAAQAQTASPAQSAPPAPPQQPPRERTSHIEGRIAFLKTELKITPAQEAQWDKVAQAMRQNETERRQGFERVRGERTAPPNALQRLEGEARFAALRAQQADRFLATFRPLYDGMSDTQKKSADELLAPRHEGHFGHRHA
jgi:protein CpxP